ncbi:hypothetical protein RHORCCE3_0092 [Rickettsia hoogstraalii str. RCCE3]|uniref:hypothetical protein n=1 Tax=Rickettsia hoogstraalii TaxID=467174 RepID=UPI00058E0830|nr:hypothetical protein [Rickettsia hoogstraalii]KJV80914.1 hypothetical protein RHORCCE3_0092 [Rickettsia hoogstraalii str. RCCE3]
MTKPYVIKLTTPFERIKLYNPIPDIALRSAIIMQAIIDATNTSTKKEATKAEYNAKKWLFENNENFNATCLEIGIEPNYVRKTAKKLIKSQQNKDKRPKLYG